MFDKPIDYIALVVFVLATYFLSFLWRNLEEYVMQAF